MKNTKVSELIRARLIESNTPFFANNNISAYTTPEELVLLEQEVEAAAEILLRSLVIDLDNDHNSKGTAKRLAKMYVREIYSGRYQPAPSITDFPNASSLDQLYTVGPITVRSTCSHHLQNISGKCWIGIHPSDRVLGLSKFHRITEWIMSRPSIQEESTVMLADEIERLIQPLGLGVVIKAKHACCSMRGVKDDSTWMTTSVVRGTLRSEPSLKEEFFSLIKE